MHIRGRLSREAPDPALESLERARRMPVPVFGLVPQRHLEDWNAIGVDSSEAAGMLVSCAVAISYTLWRNPEYIDDPVNLAELDDDTRESLDREISWQRPQWLVERSRRARYPLLWECVRTSWNGDRGPADTVETMLAGHVNHILRNSFHELRVRGPFPGALDAPVDERHAEHGVTVLVNGFEHAGIRIDTDPNVYGLGVDLGGNGIVTAVVPRDELRYLRLAFATRQL